MPAARRVMEICREFCSDSVELTDGDITVRLTPNAPLESSSRSDDTLRGDVGIGLEDDMKGVVIRQLGENYWTAYDNSSGRNDREGYGKTRDEAIADFNRKCYNARAHRAAVADTVTPIVGASESKEK